MAEANYSQYEALDPLFKMVHGVLGDKVDGDHFFEWFAEDAIWDNPFPIPGTKPVFNGRAELMEAFRGYGDVLRMDSVSDLQVLFCKKDNETEVVVMEYKGHGKAIITDKPYNNSYVSIVHIKNRKIFLWRDYVDQLIAIDAVGGMEPLIKMLGAK